SQERMLDAARWILLPVDGIAARHLLDLLIRPGQKDKIRRIGGVRFAILLQRRRRVVQWIDRDRGESELGVCRRELALNADQLRGQDRAGVRACGEDEGDD